MSISRAKLFAMLATALFFVGLVPVGLSTSQEGGQDREEMNVFEFGTLLSSAAFPLGGDFTIHLRDYAQDPLVNPPNIPNAMQASADNDIYFVQMDGTLDAAQLSALEGQGTQILGYIPESTYVLRIPNSDVDTIQKLGAARWVDDYHPYFKVDPLLDEAAGVLEIDVVVFWRLGQAYVDQVQGALEAMGAEVVELGYKNGIITINVDAGLIPEIAAIPSVEWVSIHPEPEEHMDNIRQYTEATTVNTYGFDGSGIVGEVKDSGIDEGHPDFGNLIAVEHNSLSEDHGTAVFGTVFSTGANNAQATGMMPAGSGVFEWNDVGDYYSIENAKTKHDISFQTNSWGYYPYDGRYGHFSVENDRAVLDFDVSVLYSAGNSKSSPEVLDGVHPTNQGQHCTAKNTICVGGIYHQDNANWEDDTWYWDNAGGTPSQGPSADGRIKPDITGPFNWIYTTDVSGSAGYTTNDYYDNFGGTSGSCPIVDIATGLIYEMYKENHFQNNPSGTLPAAATAKALLIAGAYQYSLTKVPRYMQGWGHADLGELYRYGPDMFIVDDGVMTQAGREVYYLEPADTGELKITLVYDDYPGMTLASRALVNDLDLRVTAPDGTVYNGNWQMVENRYTPAGGIKDVLNNVENVFIENAQKGVWKVEVLGYNIPMDADSGTPGVDQPFSLVVTNIERESNIGLSLESNDLFIAGSGQADYAITVENKNETLSYDIYVNLTLPDSLTVVSSTPAYDSYDFAGTYTWLLSGTPGPLGSTVIDVTVDVAPSVLLGSVHRPLASAEYMDGTPPEHKRVWGFLEQYVDTTSLVINEVMWEPAGGEDEWVEIYNTYAGDHAIAGWTLTDEDGNFYTLPDSTPTMPEDSYLVLHYAAGESDTYFGQRQAGALHLYTGFADILAERDQVSLYIGNHPLNATKLRDFAAFGNDSIRTYFKDEDSFTAITDPATNTGSSIAPEIAVGSDGVVHVAWSDATDILGSGIDSDIIYKYYNPQTRVWSTVEVVSVDVVGSNDPAIAVDPTGNIHVAWEDGGGSVYYSYRNPSGVWSGQSDITSVVSSRNPDITTDINGHLHVLWYVDGGQVYYKRWDNDTKSWTGELPLDSSISDTTYPPGICADANGDVHAAWVVSSRDLWYDQWNGGTKSWPGESEITDMGYSSGLHSLDLACGGPDGEVHLTVFDDNYQSVMYKNKNSAGVWSEIEFITSWGYSTADYPAIGINNFGDAGLTHNDRTQKWDSEYDEELVFYRRSANTKLMQEPRIAISNDTNDAGASQDATTSAIAGGPDGRFHIVWTDNTNNFGSGTDTDIYYIAMDYTYVFHDDDKAVDAGIWTDGDHLADYTSQNTVGRDQYSTDADVSADLEGSGGADSTLPTPGRKNLSPFVDFITTVTKVPDFPAYGVGDQFNITVVFDNVGDTAANTVWINLTLPSALLFVTSDDEAARTVGTNWEYADFAPGQNTITILLEVTSGLTGFREVFATASVQYSDLALEVFIAGGWNLPVGLVQWADNFENGGKTESQTNMTVAGDVALFSASEVIRNWGFDGGTLGGDWEEGYFLNPPQVGTASETGSNLNVKTYEIQAVAEWTMGDYGVWTTESNIPIPAKVQTSQRIYFNGPTHVFWIMAIHNTSNADAQHGSASVDCDFIGDQICDDAYHDFTLYIYSDHIEWYLDGATTPFQVDTAIDMSSGFRISQDGEYNVAYDYERSVEFWLDSAVVESLSGVGSRISEEITLPANQAWENLTLAKYEPEGTELLVTVLDGASGLPIAGYEDMAETEIDISGIDAFAYPSIKLRLDIASTTGQAAGTPHLEYWHVTWVPGGYQVVLEEGWNYISTPLIPPSTAIDDVISSISGLYDKVMFYNASDATDPWKDWTSSKEGWMKDLTDLDHTNGFWVNIPSPTGETVIFTGPAPAVSQDITIKPGWNMVGYPSSVDTNTVVGALSGIDYGGVWYYDAVSDATIELGPLEFMERGRGYWLYSTGVGDQVWTVPLDYIPPKIDYLEIVDTPDAGAVTLSDSSVNTEVFTTGFAAGFNDTFGYIMDVSATWTVESTAGAAAATSDGAGQHEIFDSGASEGTAYWNASLAGAAGDSVRFTIDDPDMDYIQIRTAANGLGSIVGDVGYTLDETDTYYCAGYNYTSGYFRDLSADWSSNDTDIVTVTTPGTSTAFLANATNVGTANVTATYNLLSNTTGALTVISPAVDALAAEDLIVEGTVTGAYTDTQDTDNTYESILERESGGVPASRHSYLEHRWSFDVTAGNTITFYVEAYQSVSPDGDNFLFEWSYTVDSGYATMVTVTKTADNDAYQTFEMPNTVSGIVYVRVVDTDQTTGNRDLDTVYIDHMFIRSDG